MPMQRYKPEQIVTVLRQIEVALAKANGKSTPQAGIVKLTGCRESKPPHRVFRRGFTDDILGLSQLVMR